MASSFITPEHGQSLNEIMLPDVNTTVSLFGMHVRHVSGEWDYPLHEHPQYEINYVIEGEQLMMVDDIPYRQSAGDLILLPPGCPHSSRSVSYHPFTYFCIHFDIDDILFLSLLAHKNQVLFPAENPVTQKVQPVLARLTDMSKRIATDTKMAFRMRLQSTIFELFGLLCEAFADEAVLISPAYERVELAHLIRNRLQGLMNQQLRNELSDDKYYGVNEIASELGISSSHCNRVFKQVFGISPRAYWSDLMLHEARLLLSNPRLTVQEISNLIGYKDIAHFSRQFKRWSGTSPSRHRQMNTNS